MVTGPGDKRAAGRGRLRASHADREQVIAVLKAAFVQGMLAKDEFDLRVGRTFASRTYAELAAITADLPVEPTAAQPPRPARAWGDQPVLRPGTVIAAATALCGGVWAFTFLPPWPVNSEGDPPHAVIMLFFLTNFVYLIVSVMALTNLVATWHEKRSARRPAPGAGGPAARRPPSASARPGTSTR